MKQKKSFKCLFFQSLISLYLLALLLPSAPKAAYTLYLRQVYVKGIMFLAIRFL